MIGLPRPQTQLDPAVPSSQIDRIRFPADYPGVDHVRIHQTTAPHTAFSTFRIKIRSVPRFGFVRPRFTRVHARSRTIVRSFYHVRFKFVDSFDHTVLPSSFWILPSIPSTFTGAVDPVELDSILLDCVDSCSPPQMLIPGADCPVPRITQLPS